MLNENSIRTVDNSLYRKFRKPVYESYCFSNIPDTVRTLFGLSAHQPLPKDVRKESVYQNVVFILIDGFGWRFFEKYVDHYPFLKRFLEKGIVSKITSQFPSTTAAHVTSLNTGLPVGQTGVYEWFQYEPLIDEIISPLLFSYAGDKAQGTLESAGLAPQDLFPLNSFYEKLSQSEVDCFLFSHQDIIDSAYSTYFTRGCYRNGYSTVQKGLGQLADLLKKPSDRKRYFYFYLSDIDSAGHRYGCYSKEFDESVEECMMALEECFYDFSITEKTALLVSADHGMTDVDPKETIYLNEQLPEIIPFLKKNKKEQLIVAAGSCRDFFLHVREDQIPKAKKLIEGFLKDKAYVVETEHLIHEGFFGPKVSKAFQERVGNLVILPRDHYGIWWHDKPRFSQHFYGVHGGLSHQEMDSIFLFSDI